MAGGLNVKQRRFVEFYVQLWNATKAAEAAGYRGNGATLAQVGYELLRKPEIAEEVKRVLSASAMSAEEVLMRLADTARSDIGPYLDDEGRVSIAKLKEANATHLIRRTKYVKVGKDDYRLEVELHDPIRVQEILAKAHGLLKEKLELSGPEGEEIPVKVVNYRDGISSITAGPGSNSPASSQDEDISSWS